MLTRSGVLQACMIATTGALALGISRGKRGFSNQAELGKCNSDPVAARRRCCAVGQDHESGM